MPKININGFVREMTEVEVAEMKQHSEPAPELSIEELVRQQAQEISDLKEALELLLSGQTEVSGDE